MFVGNKTFCAKTSMLLCNSLFVLTKNELKKGTHNTLYTYGIGIHQTECVSYSVSNKYDVNRNCHVHVSGEIYFAFTHF